MDHEQERIPPQFSHVENKKKYKLAHEYGSGAVCTNCSICSGLELHFWRKNCKICGCTLGYHDVKDESYPQYEYVFQEKNKVPVVHKFKGNDTVFDWAPDDPSLVEDYMLSLPKKWQPIKGTPGAVYRHRQLVKQLPKYDIDLSFYSSPLTQDAEKRYAEYREDLRNNVAGIGEVEKIENLFWARPVAVIDSDDEMSRATAPLQLDYSDSDMVNCQRCHQPFKHNAVVVKAAKVGEAVWHAACFTCTDCGELLVDLHYFNHDGKLFCGRDYAKVINQPRCHGCDELIYDLEFVTSGAFFYHHVHFCCFKCDIPLGGQKHFSANESMYCVNCYEEMNSKVCFTCKKHVSMLGPRLQVGSHVYHSHSQCFRCGKCNKPLEGRRVFTLSSLQVCSSCRE